MNQQSTAARAERVRLLLYKRFGFGSISAAARAIKQSRNYVSKVLNGHEENDRTLDLIEAWMSGEEVAERETTAEAA